MDFQSKKTRRLCVLASFLSLFLLLSSRIVCFTVAISWLVLNPYVSISREFRKPSLIVTRDKNIPPVLETSVTKEDMDLAIQIQDQFCEIDYEDVNRKLEMIQTQFESFGLTYEVQYGDTKLDDYKNDTAFHMMPTMVYGVWNPININSIPTSIILSTELNFNSTANPKASHYTTDCSYSIPSSITTLLTLIHTIQQNSSFNHQIVFVIHFNKYDPSINKVIQDQDISSLLHQLSHPRFHLHLEYPGSVIFFSDMITGFDLFSNGLNGHNANLDYISIFLHNLPILHLNSHSSFYSYYLQQFSLSAVGRFFGLHQYYLQHNIPSVTLTTITKPATLQQRTHQGRETLLLSFYSQLKKVILLASAAEEGFTYNDSTYLPLYSNKPAETPYVQKWDIFCPCFLLIISLVLLVVGYNILCKPTKITLYYCLLLIIVQGGYLGLARLMTYAETKGEIPPGFALFILFLILYSCWLYYRLIYNNAMIRYGVCNEEEYKREILSTTSIITVLFSLLYLTYNPYLVTLQLIVYFICLFILFFIQHQNARYCLLFVYSTFLALPFMLMMKQEFLDWCFDMLLFVKNDPLFLLFFEVVIAGNLAILHYVNGITFIHFDDDEEETKEKTD